MDDFTWGHMREIGRLRQTAFPEGARVRLVRWASSPAVDDNLIVPPGTEGVVSDVDDVGTVHVDWDNGRSLGVTVGDRMVLVE